MTNLLKKILECFEKIRKIEFLKVRGDQGKNSKFQIFWHIFKNDSNEFGIAKNS